MCQHVPTCANMCQHAPTCANMRQHAPTCANMRQHAPTCANMRQHAPTCANMRQHAPTCANMRQHAPTCANMRQHAPTCANMCQHVPTCANMCQHVPTCANMCQHVPTCANMCQHVPTTCIAWPHVDLRQKVPKSEHRSSCSSLRKALSPHLPFHSSPKSPPKPHAETARSLVESWSRLQERVFLTQAFLNDQAATKTGLATQRTCSRQDVAKRPQKNGKTGELGQDRLKVRWEAVMFLFNVVNLNVWLFLSVNLAKCFVGVVWLMFGLDEGRVCWGCCGFYCMR